MQGHQIVYERTRDGWVCGPDRCSIFRIPWNWEVLTTVRDYNWEGVVAAGDFVERAGCFSDGRPRFVANPQPPA